VSVRHGIPDKRLDMVPRKLGFRFSLISYNILSQTLLNNHSHLYTNCNPKDLEWPGRGHRIISELLHDRADIICLQEVESEHLQSLYRPRLARYGYECLYKKKTGYKIDGCAIFYRSKLFRVLECKGVEFNRTDVSQILNRDNVGIIAVLKPKVQTRSKSSQLVIANTHLIFNPKRCDIKLAQLELFLSELNQISLIDHEHIGAKCCHHPTILCGDLNSAPDSGVSKFIINPTAFRDGVEDRNERLVVSDEDRCIEDSPRNDDVTEKIPVDAPNHSFMFKSVYPTQNKEGTSYVSTFSNCIVDYIFYTPKLRLESYRELLTVDELREIGPIPNSEFPSDHLTLEAKFTLE